MINIGYISIFSTNSMIRDLQLEAELHTCYSLYSLLPSNSICYFNVKKKHKATATSCLHFILISKAYPVTITESATAGVSPKHISILKVAISLIKPHLRRVTQRTFVLHSSVFILEPGHVIPFSHLRVL